MSGGPEREAGQKPGAPVLRAGPRTLVELVSDPRTYPVLLMIAVSFAWYFHFWFYQQARQAWAFSADWGHAYFVPLVSLYLLWQSREEFLRAERRVFWPGLLPMTLGVVSYLFFQIGGTSNHLGQGLSMVLTLAGMVMLLLGARAFRYCFFPVAYMVFAITLPEQWMIKMTFPLQILASEGSYLVLEILGVPVQLKGNVLHITDVHGVVQPLNVAEQCSGMRTLVSFIALGAAVSLVATAAWWKRVLLMGMALPVALALNILRVTVLCFLAQYNPNLAVGEAHTLIGMILLVLGFFVYLAIVWALNKAVVDAPTPEPEDLDRAAAGKLSAGGVA